MGDLGGSAASFLRRDGEIRASAVARLASGRDGRPDARVRAHPRRDHGGGRRLHGGARFLFLRGVSVGDGCGRVGRDHHRGVRGNAGPREQRHQARAGVLDGEPAWFHDGGVGVRWIRSGAFSSCHARRI